MTKADLRSGMVVTCRNNSRYLVLVNHSLHPRSEIIGIGKNIGSWVDLWNWNDDLTYCNHEWDIMEVANFKCAHEVPRFFDSNYETNDYLKSLWKRPEKKKYTYEQLKEILGEEFEIVKEI